MSKHSLLTGSNLHISKTNTGSVSPVGVQTPTVIGEMYADTTSGHLWVATGLTSSDWIQSSNGTSTGTTFDQDLNTTDSPTFAGLTLDGYEGTLITSNGLVYAAANLPKSAGPISDPVLFDNDDGTATINTILVNLYSTTDYSGVVKQYTLAGDTFTFTEGLEQYVVADYNGGSPIMRIENNKYLINGSSICTLLIVWRQGTTCHSVGEDSYGLGLANKLNRMLYNTESYKRSVDGGLILSETSSPTYRTVLVSSSIVYAAITPNVISSFNSSSTGCILTQVNHVGGVWTYSDVSVYNNSQYDNGTNLVSLTGTQWSTRWFFRSIGDVKQVFYVLGTQAYTTEALALLEGMPSIPLLLRDHCMYVGRIIIQRNADTGHVVSAFGTVTPGSTVINHNDTSNLQGGISSEYYHLTSSEYTGTGTGDFVRESLPTIDRLTLTTTPFNDTDAATKLYVDEYFPVQEDNLYLNDVTTWNATSTGHGFVPRLSGNSSQFLDGAGNWTTPSAGTANDYSLTSFVNQTSVNVIHNFGSYPVVQVLSSTGTVTAPVSIVNNTIYDFTVTFSGPTTGSIIATMGSPSMQSVKSINTDYTVLITDRVLTVTASGKTITLYTAVGNTGKEVVIDNASSADITVVGYSGQTIQNETSQTVPPDCALRIYSNGSVWRIY